MATALHNLPRASCGVQHESGATCMKDHGHIDWHLGWDGRRFVEWEKSTKEPAWLAVRNVGPRRLG